MRFSDTDLYVGNNMPVYVMELVGHRAEYYYVADFDHDGTYRVTVVLDNGVVIVPLEFFSTENKTTREMAQWLNRVGRKVLSASRCDSAFTLVFGKDDEGTCFKVRVLPEMIRRC